MVYSNSPLDAVTKMMPRIAKIIVANPETQTGMTNREPELFNISSRTPEVINRHMPNIGSAIYRRLRENIPPTRPIGKAINPKIPVTQRKMLTPAI